MESRSSRREFIARSAAGVAGATLLGRPLLAAAAAKDVKKPAWPFYAFDNGLRTVKTIEGKVELLKRLGYAGVELHWGPKELPRWLELLDKHRLRVNAIYTVPTLEAPINADLPQVLQCSRNCCISVRSMYVDSKPLCLHLCVSVQKEHVPQRGLCI